MLKWLFLDIKKNLFNKKSYLLLFILSLSIIYFIFNYSKQFDVDPSMETLPKVIRSFKIDTTANLHQNYDLICPSLELNEIKDYPECDGYADLLNYFELSQEYSQMQNTEANYRLKLFLLDKATDSFIKYYDDSSDELKIAIKAKSVDIEMIRALKNFIKTEITEFEDFYLPSPSVEIISHFNQYSADMLENKTNLDNNYPFEAYRKLSDGFFLANYLNDNFLLLTFIIITLLFDSYFNDYQSGVFKTILTTPQNRFNYIIMKLLSTIISSLLLFAIPIILTVIYLRIMVGYSTINFPIYITKTSVSSYSPSLKFTRIINDFKPITHYNTYKDICYSGPVSQFPVSISNQLQLFSCGELLNHNTYKLVSILEYLALVISYFVIIVIFISTINTILSLTIKNKTYNFITLTGIFGLGIILNKIFIGNTFLKFLPTTFLQPTKLLMETIPYTYLNGLTILTISIIILNIITHYLSQNKDFHY